MADLITLAQFTARVGRTLDVSEQALAGELISDASALAINIVDDATVTDTWDAATADTVPSAVVPVVVSMVRRGMDNPHGYNQESIEGYSYSGASGDGVFATRQEAKMIRKAAGKSPVGALNLEGYLPNATGTAWLEDAL